MITLDQVHKTYKSDDGVIEAVAPTSLQVERGEIFGIIGRSGAGKSTLLRIVNRLEQPTGGRVFVGRQEITQLSGPQLRAARRSIGMIFQHVNLLPTRTVLSNIAFPLEVRGMPAGDAQVRAAECLERVGLSHKAESYPAQLSGGQKQRVAIARALAPSPSILLCDEPTSALDPRAADSILSALQAANRDLGVTILIVTRALDVVRRICHAVAVMDRGRVLEQIRLGDLLAAPRTELGRLLFARPTAEEQRSRRCREGWHVHESSMGLPPEITIAPGGIDFNLR
jgi:D-methionine transport system ATP-binding protein